MASYDYYNTKPLPPPGDSFSQPPAYSSRYNDAPSSSPYYGSQPQHLGAPDRPPQSVSPINPSPFDTPFDDHVYPANSHQGHHGARPYGQQDTGYYGVGRTGSEDNMHGSDDIPLQNRPLKDANSPDHVYEQPQRHKSRRGKIRFGELGMLGANGKRIPFVVYLFTLVQIAVFIGEIVRNGESYVEERKLKED
jgi:hypothetical protein